MNRLPTACAAVSLAILTGLSGLVLPTPAWAEGASGTDAADATDASSFTANTAEAGVFGRVFGDAAPLDSVQIYAFQLADAGFRKVATDAAGRFSFDQLPAGLYRMIATKAGFLPAIIELSRGDVSHRQFVELQLATDSGDSAIDQQSFWALREEIPADILRDMTIAEESLTFRPNGRTGRFDFFEQPGRGVAPALQNFKTAVSASAGVNPLTSLGEAQQNAGSLGVGGRMGGYRVDLVGNFASLEVSPSNQSGSRFVGSEPTGKSREISLLVAGDDSSRFQLSSRNNLLASGHAGDAVDLEQYRASWSKAIGGKGQAAISADFTEQSNFYRLSAGDPEAIPEASRSWSFQGTYRRETSDRASFETGVSYRDRRIFDPTFQGLRGSESKTAREDDRVELYGRGGLRIQPAVLVAYGLYSTLRDGSVSLIPQGGVVVQIDDHWQASALVSHRVETESSPLLGDNFMPTSFGQSGACGLDIEACYQMSLTREGSNDGQLSLGAVHRRVGETLRVFFSDDFFDHLESLYMVPGDEVPEIRMSLVRRLSPNVLSRFESNIASGGGGAVFLANNSEYENDVRYIVASIDTQFENTATGLFLAFHHLQQDLNFVGSGPGTPGLHTLDLERFQVMLTQDLNAIIDLAGEWAVKLDMEMSRGIGPRLGSSDSADEIETRVLGGVAVRF